MQRFERRLEGLVEGAFAKAFKGRVEPVEIARAIEREAAGKAAIVSAGRTVVPNLFVVELGVEDFGRIGPYAEPLGKELAEMMREAAAEHRWSFFGPVHVSFEEAAEMETGTFRVRSGVSPGHEVDYGGGKSTSGVVDSVDPMAAHHEQEEAHDTALSHGPRLVLVSGGTAEAGSVAGRGGSRAVFLTRPVTVIGRGHDVDLRLDDPGVSRQHARLEVVSDEVFISDLGSTNGTTVDGVPVTGPAPLAPGQRVTIGSTAFVFLRDEGPRE